MRRIAIGTTALALAASLIRCAADAPTAPKPGGGGNNNGALQIALYTTNSNPAAGACALLQATATLNGANVADGTTIAFSTDLGTFAQNGLPTLSLVTTGGSVTTSVCSPRSGVANVKASATSQGKSGSASLPISFQPSNSASTIDSCSPSFGSPNGGTTVTISGSGFYGTPSSTRVTFTAAGISRDGLVTGVTATKITVVTPGFPEANSLAVPVVMQITLGAGTGSQEVLTAPTCFVFGTTPAGTPNVTAILPASGKNEGGTRASIVGSGFVAPVQVFFGTTEAAVQSVAYNQVVVLTPPATGLGQANQNQTVDVMVKEVNTGISSTLSGGFTYGPEMKLIAFQGFNVQPAGGPFTPLTIIGQGFDAPVQVSLAGIVATVLSVSATELVVVPGGSLACGGASGAITVTNLNTGETATGLSFTYSGTGMTIASVSPAQADVPSGGLDLVITGTSLFNPTVTLGGVVVPVVSSAADGSSVTVHIPATTLSAPTCGGSPTGTELPVGAALTLVLTNASVGCQAGLPSAFQYQLPCVP